MAERSSDTQVLRPSGPKLENWHGRVLADRYLLKRRIGEGGFGIVFEAEDRRLGRRVAAKLLSASAALHPDALLRFEIEAKAAAQIGHAGIVDVRDFGSDADGTHFIIMELIEGVDLAAVIGQHGPLPLVRCLSIAARVAQALAVAHDHGIIHRDLKPSNILLTHLGGLSDFAKVLDFGISKINESNPSGIPLTETGTVVGTPRYMAPEQAIGKERVDCRVDIYSLGIILYEMATRDVPFEGSTAYETMHLKASFEPRAASEVNPALDLPAEFDALLARALERDAHRRFATMWDFDVAMRGLLKKLDPAAAALVEPTRTQITAVRPEPAARPAQTTRPTKPISSAGRHKSAAKALRSRRRIVLLVACGLAAAAGVTAFVALQEGADQPQPPAAAKPAVVPEAPAAAPITPDASVIDDLVDIRLDIYPKQGTVELDGVVRTENPLRLHRGSDAHELKVTAPGFVSQSRSITATANETIAIRLAPARKAQTPRPQTPTPPRFPDTPIEPK